MKGENKTEEQQNYDECLRRLNEVLNEFNMVLNPTMQLITRPEPQGEQVIEASSEEEKSEDE